ncbi:hypothetical protein BGW80DRAFT_694794 [Lactifluus volemus]|nr:hypothetical protein BGW80DRAFT_694794 [Lactifluus volemus]
MQQLSDQHGSSYNPKLARNLRLEDDQRRNLGLHAAFSSISSYDFVSHNVDSASQRWRAMTLQDAAGSAPPPSSQRRRSSSLTLSPPVSHGEIRYRTLHDRAFRHPDVPYSPLLSEFVYSSHGAIPIAPPRVDSLYEPHDLQTSFAKIGESPPITSSESRNSANVRPVPPRQRPRLAGPVRNNSYPLRDPPSHLHAQRQQWSSLDLRNVPSLTTGLPSAIPGVGLSTIDNGAFEAPRPAPEPSTYCGTVAGLGTSPPRREKSVDNASRGTDSGRSQTPIGSKRAVATPSLDFVSAVSPMGFGGLSLRRYTWMKKEKPLRRSDTTGDTHADGKSKLASRPSFTSVAGNEAKPQRKGLFKSLRRT